ncbi:hypothetical protein Pan97_05380 [Bremerella volcania]|uniref:Molybdenum cofactor carrier protein n=1 Tax=Bremerella volcania TaxID=2527984 RepID=A0A518C2W4_9BACT|nr:molybdenum cofactor carrier protein [Bremerella volcania]QDU73562.1 hypothetical protein Pan97_05380 [Bremerella volcania]
MKVQRLPIVGVMGSGKDDHLELSLELGWLLGTLGVHLLTGGGRGTMAAVSEAFARTHDRRGMVLGILPSDHSRTKPKADYPNDWVEIPIVTHLPHSGERGTESTSRNHINILTSDAIVALPGGPGTSTEVQLAIRYGKPIIAYLGTTGGIPDLPQDVAVATTIDQVEAFLRSVLLD